jgi:hypothetical protein
MAMEFFENEKGGVRGKALNYEEKPLRKTEISPIIHARFCTISNIFLGQL